MAISARLITQSKNVLMYAVAIGAIVTTLLLIYVRYIPHDLSDSLVNNTKIFQGIFSCLLLVTATRGKVRNWLIFAAVLFAAAFFIELPPTLDLGDGEVMLLDDTVFTGLAFSCVLMALAVFIISYLHKLIAK